MRQAFFGTIYAFLDWMMQPTDWWSESSCRSMLLRKCKSVLGIHRPPHLRVLLGCRLSSVDEAGHVYGVRGGAGGYLETIFRHAARALFGKAVDGPLEMKTLRNADFKEVSLEVRGARFGAPAATLCLKAKRC